MLQAQGNIPVQGKITGIVLDAETGERLPFVNVWIEGSQTGTASEEDGAFKLSGLDPGTYTLTASFVGYRQEVLEHVHVVTQKSTTVAFELQPTFLEANEATVTATRRPQSAKLAPASIGIVTSQQMEAKNIRTFDQAFDDVPGVTVTRSSGANVQAFSIRGASEVAGGGIGNRVLLLVDGRPALSPESGGALWNLVPVSSVERIEVVKGAYSSLYGSSAMGGVVNVITRKPPAAAQTKIGVNYGFYGAAPKSSEYARFNDFYAAQISHSRSLGRFSYLLDGSWKHNDGHREKSGFDLFNFYAKTAYRLNGNRNIQLSLNGNRIKNDTPATWLSRRQAYSVAEHRKDDYQDRREYNADLYYYALPNANVKYSTRFYYYQNYSKYTFDGDPGNDSSSNINFGKQSVSESSVRTQRVGNISQLDLYAGDRHFLIAGTDVKLDKVVGMPDTILYGRHRAFNFGAYLQDEIKFGEKLTATVGARLDHYLIIGEFDVTNFSPKLAWVYQLKKDLSLRMLFAQAFRNPSMAERFIKFEQGGGLRFQPNPTLKPERLTCSFEFGSKMKIGQRATLDVALFYNRYKNLISFRRLSQPLEPLLYQVVNLNKAVMQGFEISYRQTWDGHLNTSIGYTYLDARDISDNRLNDNLAYKVKHTLNVSASAKFAALSVHLNARYRSRIKEVFIYPGSEPDDAFLLNTKVSYQLADKHRIYLAIDNITDAQYEELERYRMQGRSFTVGAAVGL